MPLYIVIDTGINARQGVVWGQTRLEAVNYVVQEMGWRDYRAFRRGSRGMGGVPRLLDACIIQANTSGNTKVVTRETRELERACD